MIPLANVNMVNIRRPICFFIECDCNEHVIGLDNYFYMSCPTKDALKYAKSAFGLELAYCARDKDRRKMDQAIDHLDFTHVEECGMYKCVAVPQVDFKSDKPDWSVSSIKYCPNLDNSAKLGEQYICITMYYNPKFHVSSSDDDEDDVGVDVKKDAEHNVPASASASETSNTSSGSGVKRKSLSHNANDDAGDVGDTGGVKRQKCVKATQDASVKTQDDAKCFDCCGTKLTDCSDCYDDDEPKIRAECKTCKATGKQKCETCSGTGVLSDDQCKKCAAPLDRDGDDAESSEHHLCDNCFQDYLCHHGNLEGDCTRCGGGGP
jgi:hypothetical protein